MPINNIEREGKFTASRISELLAGGTGATCNSYILDLALQSVGIYDDYENAEMRHGKTNQYNAFELVVKPNCEGAVWLDNYISINSDCGASPDCSVLLEGSHIPVDIKCPYHAYGFVAQVNSIPNKYRLQVIMQCMAMKAEVGMLLFYLSKPEKYGEEWKEYPYPLADRFKFVPIVAEERVQEDILAAVATHAPKRNELIEILKSSAIMDDDEFFFRIKKEKYLPIKKAASFAGSYWSKSYVRVGDNFFFKTTK